ncbi:MAG: family 43 glycosylhydrolase [Blastochloris sp.]|nr:family 43 glycosylhydrolase [Blastochloris sp.]
MRASYRNPVYGRSFADPFVLKYCGEYWAYSTGTWADGRWFGVLRSRDLAQWAEVGGAVEPLPGDWPCQWAPEVNYVNGRFYLYYSLGDEATMQIRVAVAEHPAGPFIDAGVRLSAEPFAIDPHVFVDDDGARYLFYATDYLEHSHIGTGIAMVRLADPLRVAGSPVPVVRARYDWQVYHPNRPEKGGVRWHTVEGPFVLKRKGRYYQMFSGGNWQNPSYGVSYAITAELHTGAEWEQVADGERVLPILRTLPGEVVGPGHNSVVRGPDNRQFYCVYHRWADDSSGRLMAIDPLDWAGERMLLGGPSNAERALLLPTIADFFPGRGPLGPIWRAEGGVWQQKNGAALQTDAADARATCTHNPAAYLAEVSVRLLGDSTAAGGYGIALGAQIEFLIRPEPGYVLARVRHDDSWHEERLALPAGFVAEAFHLLRVEVNAGRVTISLDETARYWGTPLPVDLPLPFVLITEGASAAFAGFALTEGWCDSFDVAAVAPADLGWQSGSRPAAWRIADGALVGETVSEPALIVKGSLPAAYELVVSVALIRRNSPSGTWSIFPAARSDNLGPGLTLQYDGTGWRLAVGGPAEHSFALPAGLDPYRPCQLRVRVVAGHAVITWEGTELGVITTPFSATQIALGARDAVVAFDEVRVTAIPVS